MLEARPSPRAAARGAAPASGLQVSRPAPGVEYFNGLGGFAEGGPRICDDLGPGPIDPGPVDQRGRPIPASASRCRRRAAATLWSVNSREHQLTPWSNDPVSDPPGEALYLRDEDTGELWSPTAAPDTGP